MLFLHSLYKHRISGFFSSVYSAFDTASYNEVNSIKGPKNASKLNADIDVTWKKYMWNKLQNTLVLFVKDNFITMLSIGRKCE